MKANSFISIVTIISAIVSCDKVSIEPTDFDLMLFNDLYYRAGTSWNGSFIEMAIPIKMDEIHLWDRPMKLTISGNNELTLATIEQNDNSQQLIRKESISTEDGEIIVRKNNNSQAYPAFIHFCITPLTVFKGGEFYSFRICIEYLDNEKIAYSKWHTLSIDYDNGTRYCYLYPGIKPSN